MMYENERVFKKADQFIKPARLMTAGMSVKLRLAGVAGKMGRCAARRFFSKTGGFGMNELLGIAAALVIAAFVVIPGLKELANDLIKKLGDWWEIIADQIFTTST